jgi:hypothetical protein
MKKTSRVAAKKKAAKQKDEAPLKIDVYPVMVRFIEPISVPGQNEPSTKQINLEKDPTMLFQVLDTRLTIQCSEIKGVLVTVPMSNVRQIIYKSGGE